MGDLDTSELDKLSKEVLAGVAKDKLENGNIIRKKKSVAKSIPDVEVIHDPPKPESAAAAPPPETPKKEKKTGKKELQELVMRLHDEAGRSYVKTGIMRLKVADLEALRDELVDEINNKEAEEAQAEEGAAAQAQAAEGQDLINQLLESPDGFIEFGIIGNEVFSEALGQVASGLSGKKVFEKYGAAVESQQDKFRKVIPLVLRDRRSMEWLRQFATPFNLFLGVHLLSLSSLFIHEKSASEKSSATENGIRAKPVFEQ